MSGDEGMDFFPRPSKAFIAAATAGISLTLLPEGIFLSCFFSCSSSYILFQRKVEELTVKLEILWVVMEALDR